MMPKLFMYKNGLTVGECGLFVHNVGEKKKEL